jgi:hypothetical protein
MVRTRKSTMTEPSPARGKIQDTGPEDRQKRGHMTSITSYMPSIPYHSRLGSHQDFKVMLILDKLWYHNQ